MDYLTLFSPAMHRKPRFMALASAVLSQVNDMISFLESARTEVSSLSSASGVWLDALGELLNVSRPSGSTSDEDYRMLLTARTAANRWDGRNESLPGLLEQAFPGRSACLIDNQDGTVTFSVNGTLPFDPEELFPIPAGIRRKE